MQVYHKYISFDNRIQIEVAGSVGAQFCCAQLSCPGWRRGCTLRAPNCRVPFRIQTMPADIQTTQVDVGGAILLHPATWCHLNCPFGILGTLRHLASMAFLRYCHMIICIHVKRPVHSLPVSRRKRRRLCVCVLCNRARIGSDAPCADASRAF